MRRRTGFLTIGAIVLAMMHSTAAEGADIILRASSDIKEGPAAIRVAVPPAIRDRLTGSRAALRLTLGSARSGQAHAVLVLDPLEVRTSSASDATLFHVGGRLPAGHTTVADMSPVDAQDIASDLDVPTRTAVLSFAPGRNGGLPTALTFKVSGRRLQSFAWNDRVYHATRGGWMLRNDRTPAMRILYKSPALTVIRTSARYCSEAGEPAPGGARAVYDWYVSGDHDVVFVQAFVAQNEPLSWAELHHLELNFPDASFTEWAGGNPMRSGRFSAERKGWDTPNWGCLVEGNDAVGIMGQRARFYDGRGEYGTYIHGLWTEWAGLQRLMPAWMWIGSAPEPAKQIMAAAEVRRTTRAAFTTSQMRSRIARLQQRPHTTRAPWLASVAERLEESGALALANALLRSAEKAAAPLPEGWHAARAGNLWMAIRRRPDGMALASLYDAARRTELAAGTQPPLFRILLVGAAGGDPVTVDADSGWAHTAVRKTPSALTLEWSKHRNPLASGLTVTATARLDPEQSAIRWKLSAHPGTGQAAVRTVAFPQIAIEPMGADARVLYPVGPGEEARLDRTDTISRTSLYPNGWCTMPLMAIYSPATRSGFYFACHDRYASSRHVIQRRDGADQPILFAFDVPAPHMDRPGVRFEWPGVAVWQALRGDWFDAARIYRAWAAAEAAWWPKGADEGRTDTPAWMRDLCAWAQTGGGPAECVEAVKQMQRTLGVPIGFHWYNWHQIPFDNDYPHYFPTKPGVAEAVADLQANHVHVMPYINGRLWDTRDRGTEDYQFTSRALPAATKSADGKPVTETYGSKESDGSPVHLAVMCPTTDLWKSVVRETALRIMTEVGAHGVYIDQIAAAPPVLCMDASHGHPVGGGHWWTREGYWPMLTEIRKRMPAGHMITTECAAEPYAHVLDAYLTWDWQGNGMVPVLPAIYGGRVQYFGRNYNAGATTRDLALCMKMGQQLVFGEQIGWLPPSIAQEDVAGAFLRQVVGIRHRNVRFFGAGEMARPPALSGDIPEVRADWAWYGETWVTTSAVLTGAWMRPKQRELLLIFANVSDQPVNAQVNWNARRYGITAGRLTLSRTVGLAAPGDPSTLPERTQRMISLSPRTVETWLVRW